MTVLVVLALLLGACSATPSCQSGRAAPTVAVPRLKMPEARSCDVIVYRPDPAVPGDLLLCALAFSSHMGEPGEDPYTRPRPPDAPPLVYRYRAATESLTREAANAWLNAGTPVGFLYLSLDSTPVLTLDSNSRVVVGSQNTTKYAAPFAKALCSSPNNPLSGRIDYDVFGGEGSTHSALLTASRQDRPGMIPGSGSALRHPFYVQVFSVPDGAQIGPTRLLDEGEETIYPPEGGWTYDGRYIIYYYPGMVWIIPTPEVLEAHSNK